MTVTIEFSSQAEEAAVKALAAAEGLSIADWLRKVAREEMQRATGEPAEVSQTDSFTNLSELLLNSPFAGAGLDLQRVND